MMINVYQKPAKLVILPLFSWYTNNVNFSWINNIGQKTSITCSKNIGPKEQDVINFCFWKLTLSKNAPVFFTVNDVLDTYKLTNKTSMKNSIAKVQKAKYIFTNNILENDKISTTLINIKPISNGRKRYYMLTPNENFIDAKMYSFNFDKYREIKPGIERKAYEIIQQQCNNKIITIKPDKLARWLSLASKTNYGNKRTAKKVLDNLVKADALKGYTVDTCFNLHFFDRENYDNIDIDRGSDNSAVVGTSNNNDGIGDNCGHERRPESGKDDKNILGELRNDNINNIAIVATVGAEQNRKEDTNNRNNTGCIINSQTQEMTDADFCEIFSLPDPFAQKAEQAKIAAELPSSTACQPIENDNLSPCNQHDNDNYNNSNDIAMRLQDIETQLDIEHFQDRSGMPVAKPENWLSSATWDLLPPIWRHQYNRSHLPCQQLFQEKFNWYTQTFFNAQKDAGVQGLTKNAIKYHLTELSMRDIKIDQAVTAIEKMYKNFCRKREKKEEITNLLAFCKNAITGYAKKGWDIRTQQQQKADQIQIELNEKATQRMIAQRETKLYYEDKDREKAKIIEANTQTVQDAIKKHHNQIDCQKISNAIYNRDCGPIFAQHSQFVRDYMTALGSINGYNIDSQTIITIGLQQQIAKFYQPERKKRTFNRIHA